MHESPLPRALADIAYEAGAILLKHYATEVVARNKEDASPVTAADEEAESFILSRLQRLAPEVPVIAEEQMARRAASEIGNRFFLVDPLDGTKEFISKNGEFTVNIASIVDGEPVCGVVYLPARDRLFVGDSQAGAFEIAAPPGARLDHAAAKRIRARRAPADGLVAVASRSHRDSKTDEYLAKFRVKDFVSAGSSLKFCLVAAGEADIYPRLGRTMEWDTAAGHAVLCAAGGSVLSLEGRPLRYGKVQEKFANPFFVARGAG
jgi:3'(2'), 5'-bisphosphate nucleotidase